MEVREIRPKLASFRALAINCDSRGPATGLGSWTLQTEQNIEVGLAVPTVEGGALQAVIKINLTARASSDGSKDEKAAFQAEYEGKFNYSPEVREADLLPSFETESYQYLLVAQVFPLAMTHFRRELQSMGFDARHLPLGL
jgi:hypothetical protein